MDNVRVIYKGIEYMILSQYATGYCEIAEPTKDHREIILVHFSELTLLIK